MAQPSAGEAPVAGVGSRLHLGLRAAALLLTLSLLLFLDEWLVRTLIAAMDPERLRELPRGFTLEYSWVMARPVATTIAERLPITLGLWAQAAALAAVPALLLAWAVRRVRGPWLQQLLEAPFVAASVLPVPALGLLAVLGALATGRPVSGLNSPAASVLALLFFGLVAGAVHGANTGVEALGLEWVDGPPGQQARTRWALGRALANLAWYLPLGLALTMVVEQLFRVPGIGHLLLEGLHMRDYPVWWAGVRPLLVALLTLRLLLDVAAWLAAGRGRRGRGPGAHEQPVAPPPAETAKPAAGMARRRPVPWLLLALAAVLLAYGLGPVVAGPADPQAAEAVDQSRAHQAPGEGADLPWGTDRMGRDLRDLYAIAGRLTLRATLGALGVALAAGGLLGALAAALRATPAGAILDALWSPWVYGLGAAGPLVVPLLWQGLTQPGFLGLALGAVPAAMLLTQQMAVAWQRQRAHAQTAGTGAPDGSRRLLVWALGGVVVLLAQLLAAETALGFVWLTAFPHTPTWGNLVDTMAPSLRILGASVPLHLLTVVVGMALLGHALRRWAGPVNQ